MNRLGGVSYTSWHLIQVSLELWFALCSTDRKCIVESHNHVPARSFPPRWPCTWHSQLPPHDHVQAWSSPSMQPCVGTIISQMTMYVHICLPLPWIDTVNSLMELCADPLTDLRPLMYRHSCLPLWHSCGHGHLLPLLIFLEWALGNMNSLQVDQDNSLEHSLSYL